LLKIDSCHFKYNENDPFLSVKHASLVPHGRRNYLSAVVEKVRQYDTWVKEQLLLCRKKGLGSCDTTCQNMVKEWQSQWNRMTAKRELFYTSYNGLKIPRVSLPDPDDECGVLQFLLEEGLPGSFPYVNGVFPLKQDSALQTTRQFAGLRLAEHTNQRFKFLSQGVDAPRLSTAFDGVSIYIYILFFCFVVFDIKLRLLCMVMIQILISVRVERLEREVSLLDVLMT
jgi:methylmalonyl-CoA mutase